MVLKPDEVRRRAKGFKYEDISQLEKELEEDIDRSILIWKQGISDTIENCNRVTFFTYPLSQFYRSGIFKSSAMRRPVPIFPTNEQLADILHRTIEKYRQAGYGIELCDTDNRRDRHHLTFRVEQQYTQGGI